MELILPQSQGWSALHVAAEAWGHIAVIAKRRYTVAGGIATPAAAAPVLVADEYDPLTKTIKREGELALFKTQLDWHFLGASAMNGAWGGWAKTASFSVNGVEVVRFNRPFEDESEWADAVNLFGFEPRDRRVTPALDLSTTDPKDVVFDGAALFHATRRSDGFVATEMSPLPRDIDATVSSIRGETSTEHGRASLHIPDVFMQAFVWEGGPDNKAFWCARAKVALVLDTFTMDATSVEVLWRGRLAMATHPLADLRQIVLKEEAA